MTRWPAALAALALLVGAWFVARATPDVEARLAEQFPVAAEVGQKVEGRNIGITIDHLTLADRLRTDRWQAEGTWLVVDLDAWAVLTESPAALQSLTLQIGERTYTASERPDAATTNSTLRRAGLYVQHPRSGTVVFELPDDVGEARGILRLSLFDDPADSVIEVPIDFGALDHEAEIALPAVEWATP